MATSEDVVSKDLSQKGIDVIDRVLWLGHMAACAKQAIRKKLNAHKQYINKYGQDVPEIREWTWKSLEVQ